MGNNLPKIRKIKKSYRKEIDVIVKRIDYTTTEYSRYDSESDTMYRLLCNLQDRVLRDILAYQSTLNQIDDMFSPEYQKLSGERRELDALAHAVSVIANSFRRLRTGEIGGIYKDGTRQVLQEIKQIIA